jgi:hypothetical protein
MVGSFLPLIGMVFLAVGVACAVAGVLLVRRCWRWLGPLAAVALLVALTPGVVGGPAAADTGKKADPAAIAFSTSNDAEAPNSSAPAPAWTQRTRGEFSTAQNDIEVTVHAGPHLSRSKCEQELDKALVEAVDQYVQSEMAQDPAVRVAIPRQYIRDNLVKDIHVSVAKRQVASNVDPEDMVEMYALVKFNADSRNQLRQFWREGVVRSRLETTALAVVGVLSALTIAWAVLRRSPAAQQTRVTA